MKHRDGVVGPCGSASSRLRRSVIDGHAVWCPCAAINWHDTISSIGGGVTWYTTVMTSHARAGATTRALNCLWSRETRARLAPCWWTTSQFHRQSGKRLPSGVVFMWCINCIQCESKSSPLKYFAIFPLRLSILTWNFAKFVASLYPHRSTNFGRFILIFKKIALIFLGLFTVFTVLSFESNALTSSLMMSDPNSPNVNPLDYQV